MNAIALNAVELTAPVTSAEIAYARRPWLFCAHCGRNTWRKATRTIGRGRRMLATYCNLNCRLAAQEARRKLRSSTHLSTV